MHQAQNIMSTLFGNAANVSQGNAGRPGTRSSMSSLLTGKAGLATGAIAGGLAGILLGGKKSRKFAGTAVKYGGAAIVGGLAYKAWQNWQASNQGHTNGSMRPEGAPTSLQENRDLRARFLPAAPEAQICQKILLLKAMVAAANADGEVSIKEQATILDQLDRLGLSPEDQAYIAQELANPADVNELIKMTPNKELAAEVYLASLIVIDEQNPAERGYLAMLAARLQLEPELAQHLHETYAASTSR